jgi:hypothetical protein
MPGIRIAAAGACILLLSGLTIVGAAAQTAASSTATPGKPLQLLKIFQQSSKAKAKPHVKVVAKSSAKRAVRIAAGRKTHTHIAAAQRQRPRAPEQVASAPPSENSWPAVSSAVPADVAFAPPALQPTAAPTEPAPSQFVVAGQTVQLASPDNVNEIDLAANDTAAQASEAAPSMVASAPALREIAEAEPKSDSMNAVPPPQQGSDVGSTSWILQVLAALGGAVAAGSVAWFLIGSTPQRTYG